ncbi:hypothetical protein PTT_15517 [Paecilomyces variotii No. 5]|uniref:Uncharacterized protein n=1 Tax=Byssochlamys spectabilis (strain No. 5 / NBRC 109023) TaxID=1356009 RepID=V5G3W7_BYSSN|nr:hypothetical protein PTT_15517 [Paecilomyces variotii No. 5]
MAQQGGTYCPRAKVSSPVPSDSSSKAQGWDDFGEDKLDSPVQERNGDTRSSPMIHDQDEQIDSKNDDQQWAVVSHPDVDDEEDRPKPRFSSHFDITLGWGKWKTTIFSLDVSVGKGAE